MNYLSQYLFKRKHIQSLMDNIFLSRIEQIYDLIDILKSIQFNSYFVRSNILLISSFEHLLKDLDEAEANYIKKKVSGILIRLSSRFKKEIVIMEYRKKWVTQFHLNV